jgi:hypothetical protein
MEPIQTVSELEALVHSAEKQLTVTDIFQFLRSHKNLCEGRMDLAERFLTMPVSTSGQRAFFHLMPGGVEIWKMACREGKLELFVQHLLLWMSGMDACCQGEELICPMRTLLSDFVFATKQGDCIIPNKCNFMSESFDKEEADEDGLLWLYEYVAGEYIERRNKTFKI